MGTLKNNKIAIILIYINLIFIFRVVQVCYSIRDVKYGYIFILMLIGTIIFMFYHNVLRKNIFKLLFTLFILLGLLVLYYIRKNPIETMINQWINGSLSEMSNSIYLSLSTHFNQYIPILIILIPLLVAILIALAVRKWSNIIIFFNLIIMVNFWYTGYTQTIKLYLFKALLLSMLTYCFNVYIRHKKLLIKRGINVPRESAGNIIYISVVIFSISLLVFMMPKEVKGKYDSNIFTKWSNEYSTAKKLEDLPGEKFKYDISLSGYESSNKKLGGPVSIDHNLVLKVKSDKPYYLKGSVKDFYDGYSWDNRDPAYTKSNTSEQVFYDNFSLPYFHGNNFITIYPQGIKTSTFFIPNYTYYVDAGKKSVFHNDIPTFISNDFITKSYSVNFYNAEVNLENTFKIDFIDNGESGNERIKQYYSNSYKGYLQLPDNISPSIYMLVENITKDCKTNFEKVEKIKKYLNANYKYSLKVSEIPKDQEFLDYFLNVEKQGYCTYFATATTIFCRIARIPARYVEGFNMTEKRDSKGLFMVTNENAHAWTEVFLCTTNETGIWYTVDSVPNAPVEIEKIKKEEEAIAAGETSVPGLINPRDKNNNRNNLIDGEEGVTSNKKLSKVVIIPIIAFSLILLLVIIRHVMFALNKRKILKSKSIIPLYNYSLKRLGKVSLKKSDTETDKEFALKISESDLKNRVGSIVALCYEEFYGNRVIEGFDKVKYYKFIEGFVKNKQNIIKYYFVKYIL